MWEIYSYQNAGSLAGIFNAIAGIGGSSTFEGALAMVAFIGFSAAVLAYAFAPQKLEGWQWLASVTLIMSCLFVPRTQVAIIDKTGSEAPRVIGNVPYGLAFLGGTSSALGSAITELFETAFQTIPEAGAELPGELTYQRNGLLFGSRLIAHAEDMVVRDPDFRGDTINFIRNCVAPDLANRYIDAAAFANSTNVWQSMADTNPARFSTYTDTAHTQQVAPCPDVYANLSGRIPAQATSMLGLLSGQMHPTLSPSAALSAIEPELMAAFGRSKIATASMNAADIITQGMMLNLLRDQTLLSGAHTNDPAATTLAVGQATALSQINSSWINGAKIAEQALPIVRNVIEGLTYALFPLVLLLLLLSSAKVAMVSFKNYISILIWIQLWPPLYAVLNYMATLYAQSDLASAARTIGSGYGLTLTNQQLINSTALSSQAMVAYLTIGIPMLAWAALKRMENFGSLMAGGMTALNSALNSTTSAAATGNTSIGNTSLGQVNASPSVTSAYFRRDQGDVNGETKTTRAYGKLTAISALQNSGVASLTQTRSHNQATANNAKQEATAAHGTMVGAVDNYVRSLSAMVSYGQKVGWEHTTGGGSNSSKSSAFEEGQSHARNLAKSIAQQTGVSEDTAGRLMFGMAVFGNGLANSLSGSDREAFDKAIKVTTTDDLSRVRKFAQSVSEVASDMTSSNSGSAEARQRAGSVVGSLANMKSAEAKFQQATSFAISEQEAVNKGLTLTTVTSNDPANLDLFEKLNKTHADGVGNPQQVSMEQANHLANFSPTPIKQDLDQFGNRGLPRSEADVKAIHDADRNKLETEHPRDEKVQDPGNAPEPQKFHDSPTAAHPSPRQIPSVASPSSLPTVHQAKQPGESDAEFSSRQARASAGGLPPPDAIDAAENELNEGMKKQKAILEQRYGDGKNRKNILDAATDNETSKVGSVMLEKTVDVASQLVHHPIDAAKKIPGAVVRNLNDFGDNLQDTFGSLKDAAAEELHNTKVEDVPGKVLGDIPKALNEQTDQLMQRLPKPPVSPSPPHVASSPARTTTPKVHAANPHETGGSGSGGKANDKQ